MGNCQVEITVTSEAQVCGREEHQTRVHCWKQQEFTIQIENRSLDLHSDSTARVDEMLLGQSTSMRHTPASVGEDLWVYSALPQWPTCH